MRYLLLFFTFMISTSSYSAVYKCSGNGKTTFSDAPCDASAVQRYGTQVQANTTREAMAQRILVAGVPSQELMNACLDVYRPKLKDPSSAVAASASFYSNIKGGALSVAVNGRARNSFGAYVGGNYECAVNSAGGIDRKGTELYLALFYFGIER